MIRTPAVRPWCVADESACFDEDCPKHGEAADADISERPCSTCGATETVEITTEGPPEMSVLICSVCGSDE